MPPRTSWSGSSSGPTRCRAARTPSWGASDATTGRSNSIVATSSTRPATLWRACASGSTARTAPPASSRRASSRSSAPRRRSSSPTRTARDINAGCGSTHPEHLAAAVVAQGLQVGLAFDGDADRLIAVDERGALVDGDAVMGICALDRLAKGTLRNGILVATVMSNRGLERAIREAGGRNRSGPRRRPARVGCHGADRCGDGRRAVGPRHLSRPGHHRGRDPDRHRADPDAARHAGRDALAAWQPNSEAAAGDAKLGRPPSRSMGDRSAVQRGGRAGERTAGRPSDGFSFGRRAPSPRSGSWSRASSPKRSTRSRTSWTGLPRRG